MDIVTPEPAITLMLTCDNCAFTAAEEQMEPAEDLTVRLAIGDIYTDRDCPKCGCLCYPAKKPQEAAE